MLTLRELQAGFRQSVTGEPRGELLQLIASDGFDPAARLAVYRNNVVSRITDTLSAAFPVACALVGRGFFDFAADSFLRMHLPTSGCLSDYGRDFPSFLAEFPPAAELEYLPDVARLEWAIHQVRHASASTPIEIAALGATEGDPSLLELHLAPAVQFIASAYAVDQIWIAHQGETFPGELHLANTAVQLQIDGMTGLRIANLAPATWEFRAQLANGQCLGVAIEMAMAVSSHFDPPAALAALFGEALVVGLSQGVE